MTISVIVTAHADKEQLVSFLERLKKQTHQPDELIVCMSDITPDGIKADMLVLDKNRNDWGHHKRDIGLRLATKEYVCFMNSDDEYDPSFINKMLTVNKDLMFCDWDENGRPQVSYPSIGTITAGNFVIRRKLAQSVGWNGRTYIADGEFIMRVMETSPAYEHVPEFLYTHR